jgi:hypothetical protein
MVGVAFAACSSSDDSIIEQPVNPTAPKTYTMTVQATKGYAAATRALSYDDDTKELKTTGEEGEIVKVYQSGKEIGELTAAASDDASTTLTGYFDEAPSTTAPLTFYFHTNKSTSYSDQDGTLETIASTYDSCEPATVDAGNFEVDVENHTISVPAGISFGANKQAIVRFRLQNSKGEEFSASTLLVKLGGKDIIVKPTDDGGLSELYVAVPPVSTAEVKLYAIEADVLFYHYTKTGVTFAAGKFYTITVKMDSESIVELNHMSSDGQRIVEDGEILTGRIGFEEEEDNGNYIQIADGATVMLLDAHITSTLSAGITCLGDATIVVANEDEDINEITSESSGYPGILVAAGYTLTILGPGTLTATGANGGAGIGAGKDQTAGNIIIAGGTITANGGSKAAGIGSGASSSSASSCGNILIKGGTVTAKGGSMAAGIGSGNNSACGDITITTGVTSVTATTGYDAKSSIGRGEGSASCGTITIGCTLDENGNPVGGKEFFGGYGTGTYTYPETE